MYGLTFGTVCGICAGVFVKKGAKALAFVFGGIFVLLQVSAALHISRGCHFRSALKRDSLQIVSWQRINSQSRLVQGCCLFRGVVLYFGG